MGRCPHLREVGGLCMRLRERLAGAGVGRERGGATRIRENDRLLDHPSRGMMALVGMTITGLGMVQDGDDQ